MNRPEGGTDTKKRVTTISWLPFKEMEPMYQDLNKFIQQANENHFGFGDIRITEQAQFTEYPEGGFYDWHMDCDVNIQHEPPVRKISMTLLLNDPSEFEGGDLELMGPGKTAELKQGHAIVFASFLSHKVNIVKRGVRQSLVVWFGGKPFR
jgi:PKHD-type hydroxylase